MPKAAKETATNMAPSVDEEELARFARMAKEWWDPRGKFRPLHKLNPTRLGYVRDAILVHFGRAADTRQPYGGLRILDIGCGGGLMCEPMTRLGAEVVGADALEINTEIARRHASEVGLEIDYRATTAEALAAAGERFDVIVNLEVVEHVADVGAYLGACRALIADGGLMIVSTLNRTPQSFLKAIVGAEYILRWLPRGSHDWEKFIKPSELADALDAAGFELKDLEGLIFNPITDRWSRGRDLGVNYIGTALPVSV